MTKWNVPKEKPEGEEAAPLHPAGLYDAVVVGAKAALTKNGKNMLRLEFKTGQGKVHGRLVHSPESDKANWAFFQQLTNLGVTREFLDNDPELEDIAAEVLKARVMIRVDHRSFENKPFADVDWVDRAPVSEVG